MVCSNLITNPKLRFKHINRTEVLDRVGGLLLLPNADLATTKQVAEFYGVGLEAIKAIYNRNRAELEGNGTKTYSYKELQLEISNSCDLQPLEINLKKQGVSPKGSTIFNKRAILLVGFMLRDSKVAQEVRNQALNIIENASDEHKTMEITKEKELLMAIMFASNEIERATAINVHLEYVNRHKKKFITYIIDVFLIKIHIIMLLLEKITINFCIIAKTHDSLSLVTMLA